jgi:hypothetical protein
MGRGVDLSHWQTITDYGRARAAVDWVQIKLSDAVRLRSGALWTDAAALTHYQGFAGRPRGAYHFARPTVGIREQVAHFLARKAAIGVWERPDMLDAEAKGTTGAWVAELVAEYRRQSGRRLVLVYSPVDPAGWWDSDCVIWRARYRRTGEPPPDTWAAYLGWPADHPGLGIVQWDDAWPLPGGPVAGVDVNTQRVQLAEPVPASQPGGDEMFLTYVPADGSPSRAAVLSGSLLLDITDDLTAREFAQAAINRGAAVELRVEDETWRRLFPDGA